MSIRRRFRIIKEIAEGGFGKVYLAEQTSADGFSRIVAVKLLHSKWSSHDEVVMRTRDEARLLGLLRHQHIVKVEDLTSIDGKCAIVMEYLEGVDLKWMSSFLKERGEHIPRAALFESVSAVCSALDAAYNAVPLQGGEPLRVIHRDIKPSNIFVTVNGAIKLLDFGTSRANFAEREAKTQALAFGSQGYMAPERMLGEPDTPAADIFSLGITLYELLSQESFGRIPPRPNKFNKKATERVRSLPLQSNPEANQQIRDLLAHMLEYDPEKRPSAAEVVETAEAIAETAADMSLRRFCRTLVAEAKANEPEFDSGDPLAGKVVDEDLSRPMRNSADLGDTVPPPSLDAASTVRPSAKKNDLITQELQRANTPGSSDDGSSSKGLYAAIAVVLGLLFFGGIGLAGVAFYFLSQPTESVTSPVPVPAPEVPAPAVPAPEVPVPEAPPAASGQVLQVGNWGDAPTTETIVRLSGAASAEVDIKQSSYGFKASWDGTQEFNLGPLGEGSYSTNVTPEGGKKIRGKRFSVQAGKKCEFTFDVDAKDWTGACQ
jgi:serine/threonine-protein kinase